MSRRRRTNLSEVASEAGGVPRHHVRSLEDVDTSCGELDTGSESSLDESDGSNRGTIKYDRPRDHLSLSQFATLTHHYLKTTHNLTDRGEREFRVFQTSMRKRRETLRKLARLNAERLGDEMIRAENNDNALMDAGFVSKLLDVALDEKYELNTITIRNAKEILAKSTGIKVDHIDRCPNGCMAFNNARELNCSECEAPRYKEGTRIATATFPHIRIIPRLRLWFSDPAFVNMICRYQQESEMDKDDISDFWNSTFFTDHLKEKARLFADDLFRDLAFMLTTDELSPYKSKAYYRVAPLVLACYNIPPHLRFKTRFLLVTGFIPGRLRPEHVINSVARSSKRDTFIQPLVNELKKLQKGVRCYDSISRARFKLFGHLCVVAADMVERATLLGFFGHRGKSGCEYCRITGLSVGGMYFPITAPTNASARIRRREQDLEDQGLLPFFSFSPEADETRKNIAALTRTEQHIDRCLTYIKRYPNDRKFQSLHGIRKESIFACLSSILVPFSFPPDHMHLGCNIGKTMVEIYNGSIFAKRKGADVPDEDNGPNPPADRTDTTDRGRRKNANPTEHDENVIILGDPEPDPDPADLEGPEDDDIDFVIPDEVWEEIGKHQEYSHSTIPSSIGTFDNISKYMATMTSASWFNWILHQSLVFFSDTLPDNHFKGYSKFVQAMNICSQKRIERAEVDRLEVLIDEFIEYFETEIYSADIRRIQVWRPVIHQLRHVPEFIRLLGPMSGYSQWTVERYNQRIKRVLLKNRVTPNEHLGNFMKDSQRINGLGFVLPLVGGISGIQMESLVGDKWTDDAGNLKLGKIFDEAMLKEEAEVARIMNRRRERQQGAQEPDNPEDQQELDDAGFDNDAYIGANFYRNDLPWQAPNDDLENNAHDYGVDRPRQPARRRRLRLPRAGSGSESSQTEESDSQDDADEEIGPRDAHSLRLLKQPIRTGQFAQLIDNHKRAIIATLNRWDWLSERFQALGQAEKIRLLDTDLEATKWKTLNMVRKFSGPSFTAPLARVNITGAESAHWNRKKSAAWVFYFGPDGSKRFGQIQYFLTIRDSRRWPFDDENDDDDDAKLHLAVVHRHYPNKVRGCLYRFKVTRPRNTLEVIETEGIEDQIGLVQWRGFYYITMRMSGCFVDGAERYGA